MTLYTTKGYVRSDCGHRHKTIGAAWRCMKKDGRDCAGLPGGNSYSDRYVARVDGEPLTEADERELDALDFEDA
jgi:hypothetical protein